MAACARIEFPPELGPDFVGTRAGALRCTTFQARTLIARRSSWQSRLPQTRCLPLRRGDGRNQARQIAHGRLGCVDGRFIFPIPLTASGGGKETESYRTLRRRAKETASTSTH
jgi:hypothetical protein